MSKKITQDALRRAMSEHKQKLSAVKKIESPLAKYTESGQLMCILCKMIVRNETIWKVHVNSRSHKENVELAKKTKLESIQILKPTPSITEKRFSSFSNPQTVKKLKSTVNVEGRQTGKVQENLPSDFFDGAPASSTIVNSLIENIENFSVKESPENIKVDETKKEKDTNLPEGFFDDPVLDAKVRNVEYKNPMEEEWERFQKEIKEETAQSAQIIADDQEEAQSERQLEEIEDQLRNWSRVMDLVKRKESVQREERKEIISMDDSSSNEEEEYDDDMDWRSKKSK